MSKISDALAKLDPLNDNHWTSDGLPRIDTVRMLASNPGLNREQITAEMPNFSRQTANNIAAEEVATPVPAEEVLQDAGIDYDALLLKADEAIQEARINLDKAQAEVNRLQNEKDNIINLREESGSSESTMDVIQGYLQSQQSILKERARRTHVLHESGVTLQDIQALIPQVSPLDKSLAGRKK